MGGRGGGVQGLIAVSPGRSLPPEDTGAGSALPDACPSSAGCSLLEGVASVPGQAHGGSHAVTPAGPQPQPLLGGLAQQLQGSCSARHVYTRCDSCWGPCFPSGPDSSDD